jgi:hypothetical protein
MPTAVHPVAGRWYQHLGKRQEFQVIDIDESGPCSQRSTSTGDIEAIGLENWYELELEAIELMPYREWPGARQEAMRRTMNFSSSTRKNTDEAITTTTPHSPALMAAVPNRYWNGGA